MSNDFSLPFKIKESIEGQDIFERITYHYEIWNDGKIFESEPDPERPCMHFNKQEMKQAANYFASLVNSMKDE